MDLPELLSEMKQLETPLKLMPAAAERLPSAPDLIGMISSPSQLRRASVSIPSNIAEGSSRKSKKDYARFIEISIGSLNEIESLLFVSHQLDFIDAKTLADYKLKVNEIGGLLGGFRRYLLK